MSNYPILTSHFTPVQVTEFYQDNIANITTNALKKEQESGENAAESLILKMFRLKMQKMGADMYEEAVPDILYPTGFPTIDYLNGYIADQFNKKVGKLEKYFNLGITDGSYVCLCANSGVGKSTFANQIAANIIRPFDKSTIMVEDLESGMTEQRRRDLSGFSEKEFNNRYIVRNAGINPENIFKRIKTIHDIKTKEAREEFVYDTGRYDVNGNPIFKLYPTVWIIDSIAALMPQNMQESDELAGNSWGAKAAAAMSQLFQMIIPLLKAANIILIGINHFAQDVQMTAYPTAPDVPWLKPGERIPKGKKVTLLANNIFRMDNSKKLKIDEEYKIEGSVVRFSLVKSRSSGIKRPVKMVYDFVSGFDPWLSMVEYLRENKLLYGGGSSISFDPERVFKFSFGTFRDKINNDKEFRDAFAKHMKPILETIPTDIYKPTDSGVLDMSGFY